MSIKQRIKQKITWYGLHYIAMMVLVIFAMPLLLMSDERDIPQVKTIVLVFFVALEMINLLGFIISLVIEIIIDKTKEERRNGQLSSGKTENFKEYE